MIFPKPKRSKLEIYNDILSAIELELQSGQAKPIESNPVATSPMISLQGILMS